MLEKPGEQTEIGIHKDDNTDSPGSCAATELFTRSPTDFASTKQTAVLTIS